MLRGETQRFALLTRPTFLSVSRVMLRMTAFVLLVACSSARGLTREARSADVTLGVPVAADSARRIIMTALIQEDLVVSDTATTARGPLLATKFVVRRGGLGETEVRVALRIVSENTSPSEPSTVIELQGTSRQRRSLAAGAASDPNAPVQPWNEQPIHPDDRESLDRVARLVRRLESHGAVRLLATR
jgi:hypothetical protein